MLDNQRTNDEKFDEEGEILQEMHYKMNLDHKGTFIDYVMIDCDVDCVEKIRSEIDIISHYSKHKKVKIQPSDKESMQSPPRPNRKSVPNTIHTLHTLFFSYTRKPRKLLISNLDGKFCFSKILNAQKNPNNFLLFCGK